jgi:hypothetical protein
MELKRHAEHTTLDRLIAVIFHDFGPRVCFFPVVVLSFYVLSECFLCVSVCVSLLSFAAYALIF